MSRYPSGLETALPQQSIGANQAPRIQPPTFLQQLTAPGVAPVARTERTSTIARQVLAGMGAAAGLAGQVGAIADEQRRELEEQNRKYIAQQAKAGALGMPMDARAGQEAMEAYDTTDAIRVAKITRDKFAQDLANGKFNIGADEDIGAALARVTLDESEGRSDTFRAVFNTAFREQAADLLITTQQRFKEDTYEKLSAPTWGALDSSAEAGFLSPERAGQIVEMAMRQGAAFGKTPEQVVGRAVIPAAEAIAARGDVDSLAALLPHIKKRAPEKAARLAALAENVRQQNVADRERATIMDAEGLEQQGTSLEEYGAFLADKVKFGALTETKRVAMIDQYTAKLARPHVPSGNYKAVDGLIASASKDPDTQAYLANQREAAVGAHRQNIINSRVVDVKAGRRAAIDVYKELGSRVEAGRNPANPEGISFDQYRAATSAIESGINKDNESMIRKEQIMGAWQPGKEGSVQAVPEDDNDILSLWGAMGLADAQGDGDKLIFRGVTRPEAAARLAASVGRVPKKWADNIAVAFNTANADGESLQLAMRAYGALGIRNPALAAQVYSGLNDTGKVRADTLMIEIERSHQLAVDPQTGEPNSEWVGRIKELTPTILNAKPVNLAPQDLTTMLWGDKPDVRAVAPGEISRVVPDALRKSKFLLWTTQDFTVNPIVANDYADFARARLKSQIAAGVPEHKAIDNAKALAADDLLAKHPPVLWNGTVSIGGAAPYVFTAELETELVIDIVSKMPNDMKPAYLAGDNEMARTMQKTMTAEAMARATLREGGFSHILTQARPAWDRTFGASGAWVLRDDNGNNVVLNGQEFGFIPTVPDQPNVKQLRQKYEREARQRRAEVKRGMVTAPEVMGAAGIN